MKNGTNGNGRGGTGGVTNVRSGARLIEAMIRRGHRFETEDMDELEAFFWGIVRNQELCTRDRMRAAETLRTIGVKGADLAVHREKLESGDHDGTVRIIVERGDVVDTR
jgi:hypothetical protein